MGRSFLVPVSAFAFVLAPALAVATVMVPLTIEDMTAQSACIVRGKVLESRASWDKAHQRIYTFTEIEVLDTLHSASAVPQKIVVKTLGGEVGEIGMRVSGTEKFEAQEEVVIFLRKDPVEAANFQTIGMSQGKLRVERDAKGKIELIPSHEGLAFARPDETGSMKINDASAPARISFDDLKTRVKVALANKVPVQTTSPVTQPNLGAQPNGPAVQTR
jgi:hypothetical protein